MYFVVAHRGGHLRGFGTSPGKECSDERSENCFFLMFLTCEVPYGDYDGMHIYTSKY